MEFGGAFSQGLKTPHRRTFCSSLVDGRIGSLERPRTMDTAKIVDGLKTQQWECGLAVFEECVGMIA